MKSTDLIRKANTTVNDTLTVSYALTHETRESGGARRDSYSISATLYENGKETDHAVICDVTSISEEAERLFGALSAGGVTPMTLSEVISDLLP